MSAHADPVYFGAASSVSASELWSSDGTAAGTRKIREFDSDYLAAPSVFTSVPSGLFFFAGRALWKIDTSGEVRFVSAVPVQSGVEVVALGDTIVFVTGDGPHGWEIWRSDGTSEGTGILEDIAPGPDSSYPSGLRAVGDRVFFTAADRFAGPALWRTDGTPQGTRRIASIPTQSTSSTAAAANDLYFFVCASGGSRPFGLWRSDGTSAGTFPIHDFAGDVDGVCPSACVPYGPSELTPIGDRVVFAGNDGVHGRVLWSSDGTTPGTELVAQVPPFDFVGAGGALYFTGGDFYGGYDLWRTDGTPAGTALVFHGLQNMYVRIASPLAALGERLLFAADGTDDLWITDGTESGTMAVRDLSGDGAGNSPGPFAAGADGLLFEWSDQLWRTDGTEAGTRRVDDFPKNVGSNPVPSGDAGGPLFVQVRHTDDVDPPSGLWRSDGTDAGTVLLKEFSRMADTSLDGSGMVALNGAVFFAANDSVSGMELWRADGTAEGTRLVADRNPGFEGSDPRRLVALRNHLLFSIWTPDEHGSLMSTDGTEQGTSTLAAVDVWSDLVRLGDAVVFSASDDEHGTELWRSDGTVAGTSVLVDLSPGPASSSIHQIVRLGDRAFFSTTRATTSDLWVTDGTPEGTRIVREFTAPFGYTMVAAGDFVYFESDNFTKLWRTDGTEEGTIRLAVLPISWLTAVGGRVFFTADDGVHGVELWSSDGTIAATRLVRDIRPGPDWSGPLWLRAIAGRVVFSASDGVHGYEPWVSDGTADGTRILADVATGLASSGPEYFKPSGGLVYFSADDGVAGRELWAIPLDAIADTARAPVPAFRSPVAPRDLPPRP